LSIYRIVFGTKTSFNFKQSANEYSFDLKSYKAILRKIISEVDQKLSGFKYGWFIEIELEARDIHNAISQAFDISEMFLSMMTLETGVLPVNPYPSLRYYRRDK
jgi:hypothetical protein